MSTTKRRHHLAVIDRVATSPHRFGFFQAVRVLDRWLEGAEGAGSGLRRIVFRNALSLAFPASEIESLVIRTHGHATADAGPDARPDAAGTAALPARAALSTRQAHVLAPLTGQVERIELTPSFMGLLGASGTLPHFYTEVLAHRELYGRDGAGRAFMDIFSSRAVTLFYQAWRKHRLPIHYEADARNRFLPHVLALAGLGQRGLRNRLRSHAGGVADESVAYFAGTLQRRRVSAPQLESLLAAYLQVPVRVEPFVGRWYTLPEPARAGLGARACGGLQLGRNAVVGERIWQRDLCVRLTIGPLPHELHRRFLPGGPGHTALREWLTLFTGHALEYEVNLLLKRDDVHGVALHGSRPAGAGRLGWDTFLQAQRSGQDRADVRYFVQVSA